MSSPRPRRNSPRSTVRPLTTLVTSLTLWVVCSTTCGATGVPLAPPTPRVLVLSVDGLHETDLVTFVRDYPSSAMARIMSTGIHYPAASTPRPSDSFPCFLALVTGGSPVSTGVWYDDNYDRSLWPPGVTEGPTGTSILYSEVVDVTPTSLDGGGGIDPRRLPGDPARGGAPVYPHDFLRVNTIFEVVKAAGGRTAYCEKHLSYEIAQGPSGAGVDDFFAPEIAAYNQDGVSITKSVTATEAYDDIKVNAVLAQIHGYDHTSNSIAGVPALFGMNFQALSVSQRLLRSVGIHNGVDIPGAGGYVDEINPGPLVAEALAHTDQSLGLILDALKAEGLVGSTYVILVGKHGNSPMDPGRLSLNPTDLAALISQATPVAKITADDVGLVWLQNQGEVDLAVSVLKDNYDALGIQELYYGESLKTYWDDPLTDPRTPDILFFPKPGVIYTTSSKRIAEHGGGAEDDVHVALVISHPSLGAQNIKTRVTTMQVAPTILELLGLNPLSLQAVVQEHTQLLPGFEPLVAAFQVGALGETLAFDVPSILNLAGDQAQFHLTAVAPAKVLIQSSSDLQTWRTIGTNTLMLHAEQTVTDPDPGVLKSRFYRALKSP